MRPGLLTGLQAEARIAAKLGVVEVGGGTRAGAAAAAARLAASGVDGLISFGVAGGLAPGLAPGAIVVPSGVWVGGRVLGCDPALLDWLGGANAGLVADHPRILASAEEKQALHAATGAVAVDLESGPLALAAEAAGLGFAVVRAVCDPAERDLPPAALAALDSAGGIAILRVAGSVLFRPGQVPALLRLARDAAAARAALRGFVARKEPS